MARPRTGTLLHREGKLYARIDYTDSSGKRRSKEKRVKNKTEGRAIIAQFVRDLEEQGSDSLGAVGTTFNELAKHLEQHFLIPPKYVEGRKVAGKRSYKDDLGLLKILREYFGRMELREISWGKIERFRVTRLETPTYRGTQRSVARVNRELSLLRHAFSIAVGERWIPSNPFKGPKPLISAADEIKRKRVLEREEEMRLLAACTEPRAHLRPLLICALDTGMRRGELFKLKWADLNFNADLVNISDGRKVTVQEFNTKTLRERQVPITQRLRTELSELWEASEKDPLALVFGISSNVSKSFATACRIAQIEDLRFHDLRRTFGTRLAKKKIPVHEIARLLGHTDIHTTFIYLGLTEDSLEVAAKALDEWNAETVEILPQPKAF